MKTHRVNDENLPPTIKDVNIYFSQRGLPESEAENFYRFYEKKQWKSKNGFFFKDWKSIAYKWSMNVFKAKPLLFNKNIH